MAGRTVTRRPNAKLTDADVLLILRCGAGLRGSPWRRAQLLAPSFHVSVSTVRDILVGEAWMHVSRPFLAERARQAAERARLRATS